MQNRLGTKHNQRVGRPTVFSEGEEKLLVQTLAEVANWGYPLTQQDMKVMLKGYLDKRGRVEPRFKNNVPGDEFVRSFVKRNRLSYRSPGNIKLARAKVGQEEFTEYFNNIHGVLSDTDPSNIYNYDETNVSDDPGCKRVLVPRSIGRVERVQEYSKMAISIMVCGNATGTFLPPFVDYKAQNVYENWTRSGPDGAKYAATKSGWFDKDF